MKKKSFLMGTSAAKLTPASSGFLDFLDQYFENIDQQDWAKEVRPFEIRRVGERKSLSGIASVEITLKLTKVENQYLDITLTGDDCLFHLYRQSKGEKRIVTHSISYLCVAEYLDESRTALSTSEVLMLCILLVLCARKRTFLLGSGVSKWDVSVWRLNRFSWIRTTHVLALGSSGVQGKLQPTAVGVLELEEALKLCPCDMDFSGLHKLLRGMEGPRSSG
ncbi:MAG: hypothetical protein JJU11_12290 [Candidatus Sumerlaeia bacterium]|nr:hypothetical protein [Candidatus Sumerlaeia bacterium]